LENNEIEEFKEIETRLTYEDILLFRGLAQGEIDYEVKTNKKYMDYLEKKKQINKKWFSWNQEVGEEPAVVQLTEEQKLGLYKDIGYSKTEEIETLKLPEDYVKVALTARINQGSLYLDDHETQMRILQSNLSYLNVDFELREVGAKFKVALNNFDVIDCYNQNSLYTNIACRRRMKHQTLEDLGSFYVDYKPTSKKSDIEIGASMKQIDLVFNHEFIQRISKFNSILN
jgi:hypothetical protein